MTGLIINPGTGPVEEASLEVALANLHRFLNELGLKPLGFHFVKDEGDGRFSFNVYYQDRSCEIEMPGIPAPDDVVDGNIWDFPRLYVEGSSWAWRYATGCARSVLVGEDEDEEE